MQIFKNKGRHKKRIFEVFLIFIKNNLKRVFMRGIDCVYCRILKSFPAPALVNFRFSTHIFSLNQGSVIKVWQCAQSIHHIEKTPIELF